MDPFDYVQMLVSTYNPNQYERLIEQPARRLLLFFAVIVGLSLLLFTALIVPVTYHYISTIPNRTAEMQQLQISADVSSDHQVLLLNGPTVILDTSQNATRSGTFTLTNEGLIYPRYGLFGESMMRWGDVRDLKQQTPTRDHLLGGIIIFLMPSIIFWFFIVSMLLLGLMYLIMITLGWAIPKAFGHTISYAESAKLGLIALPSTLIFTFGLFSLGVTTVFWGGIIVTLVLFGIGVAVISDMDLPQEHPKRQGKV